jgi:hypothetical protein
MKQLETWFFNNDLIINITKTEAMSFHLPHSKPTYKPHIVLYDKDSKYGSEVKFLGLCITENLSWRTHICYLCKKIKKSFFAIRAVKNSFSGHVLWSIYFARFHVQLIYGIILWGEGGSKERIRALRIQKKVIRLITGLKRLESCRQKFKESKILTVTSMYILEVLCFTKKHIGVLKKKNMKSMSITLEANMTSTYNPTTRL